MKEFFFFIYFYFIYVFTRVEVCARGSVRNGEWGFGGLVTPFSLLALIFHVLWVNHIFRNVVPCNFVQVLQQEAWNQRAWFWCNPNTETISFLIFILSITCIRKSETNLWIIQCFDNDIFFTMLLHFDQKMSKNIQYSQYNSLLIMINHNIDWQMKSSIVFTEENLLLDLATRIRCFFRLLKNLGGARWRSWMITQPSFLSALSMASSTKISQPSPTRTISTWAPMAFKERQI